MDFPEIADLEVLDLRKKVKELEQKLRDYEVVLKENDLLDQITVMSDTEQLCIRELQRFEELSKKGAGLTLEDVKIVDILHKNLLLAKGKAVPVEKEKKGKKEQPDIAKLLQIASAKPANDE